MELALRSRLRYRANRCYIPRASPAFDAYRQHVLAAQGVGSDRLHRLPIVYQGWNSAHPGDELRPHLRALQLLLSEFNAGADEEERSQGDGFDSGREDI